LYNKSIKYVIILLLFFAFCASKAKDCIPNREFELIENGDFELGDTLFITDYFFSTRGKSENTYSITTNPNLRYSQFDSCGDHTTGSTNMLIINGDTSGKSIVWGQTVNNLKQGTDYEFSFWITSVNELKPPAIIVLINNDTLLPYPVYVSDSSCYWQNFLFVWNSNTNDSAEIRIYDIATHVAGNDFALDDISFMEYCRIQACAGQSLSTCKDIPISLAGMAEDGIEPYRYSWSPAGVLDNSGLQNPVATISQTTRFVLKVTDARNCVAYDTIDVYVYDEPDNTITSSHQMPACPCETVTLNAPQGMKYLWSTGDTGSRINVTEPGIYTCLIEDSQGCKSEGSFELTHKYPAVDFFIDTINTSTGKDLSIEIKSLTDNILSDCGYTDFTADIKYNASLLVPRYDTPFGVIENGYETITVTRNINELQSNPLIFYTVWGNAQCTDISIENLKFICDSVIINLSAGRVCLDDLCEAGGLRLFDSGQKVSLMTYLKGNNLIYRLTLKEDMDISLSMSNVLGESQEIIPLTRYKSGEYESEIDLSVFSRGVYFITVRTSTKIITHSFIKN